MVPIGWFLVLATELGRVKQEWQHRDVELSSSICMRYTSFVGAVRWGDSC